ncbi:MAG TPA: PQQ-binding-like beta-propeller repeat protein [Thermoanaerobaculia bacterium]|nr:PQQ-binding-like beta-propeller repeat protein [Thermoanaerobaculia bacterium]
MRRRSRHPAGFLCAAAGALLASVAASAAQRPNVELRTAILPPSLVIAYPSRGSLLDWPKYCGNLAMTGVAAAERAISTTSAPGFVSAWTDTLPGTIASSPIVVDGRVYVGDWSGKEWALDASSGAVLGSADLGTTSAPKCNPPTIGITSAPAVTGGVVYVAGGDDGFYALDAQTLAVLWRTSLGNNLHGYYGWCSPAVIDGVVYQGVSSNCDNPFIPGAVDALDAATGTITASVDLSGGVTGAGVWSSPAIDRAAGTVFVTVASGNSYELGRSYSIARLAVGSLAVEDHWKIPPEDYANVPDADWGSSPTLFTDSGARDLVGAGQKDGYYYAFLRGDLAGGPVWKTALAVGGECPQCGHGTISTAAFDGKRIYVGAGVTPDYTAYGSVNALDPATGSILWTYKAPGAVLAPISFANGVVFAAGGKRCVALDAETGTLLWQTETAAPLYGGIAISNGRIFFGDVAGNLYAFSVPVPAP